MAEPRVHPAVIHMEQLLSATNSIIPLYYRLLILTSFTMATTKVALITASSAGLGAQIARVFAPDFRVVRAEIPFSHMFSTYLDQVQQLTYPGNKLLLKLRASKHPHERALLNPRPLL